METNLKDLIETIDFEKLFDKLGYDFYTDGDYNLNIIGVRNLLEDDIQRDTFNDALVLIFKEKGEWVKKVWEITTDPSLKLLKAPSNSAGTAILVPDQYTFTYKIDKHKGQYEALCQRLKSVKVYRDKNKNNKLDMDPKTIQSGMFGINIHRASAHNISESIGAYSAGCQVFKSYKDFDEFMKYAHKYKNLYQNAFTYTLVTTNQIQDNI